LAPGLALRQWSGAKLRISAIIRLDAWLGWRPNLVFEFERRPTIKISRRWVYGDAISIAG
jgi:hypothetical protein